MQETQKFLKEFFTCPICWDLLKNPVTTDCGHNHCMECLNKNQLLCALCRKITTRPTVNYGLKNALENLSNQLKTANSLSLSQGKTHFSSSKNNQNRENIMLSETKKKIDLKPTPASDRPSKYRVKRLFNEMIKLSTKDEVIPKNLELRSILKSEKATREYLDNMMKEWESDLRNSLSFENHNFNINNSADSTSTNSLSNLNINNTFESQIIDNYLLKEPCQLFNQINTNPISYCRESSNGLITKKMKKF